MTILGNEWWWEVWATCNNSNGFGYKIILRKVGLVIFDVSIIFLKSFPILLNSKQESALNSTNIQRPKVCDFDHNLWLLLVSSIYKRKKEIYFDKFLLVFYNSWSCDTCKVFIKMSISGTHFLFRFLLIRWYIRTIVAS